jgi:methanogenic corrinoid protein MtbC1
MATIENLSKCVIRGNVAKTKKMTQALIDEGAVPLDIINKGLIAVTAQVLHRRRWWLSYPKWCKHHP